MAAIYPIETPTPGRLAIVARPRGGDWLEDDLRALARTPLDVVVSLLEPAEAVELELQDEAELCHRAGLRFVSLPVADRGVPDDRTAFGLVVTDLVRELAAGRGVGIHCRMGVGRSAVVAACVLQRLGLDVDNAWRRVGEARGRDVPDTQRQCEWVTLWAADQPLPIG